MSLKNHKGLVLVLLLINAIILIASIVTLVVATSNTSNSVNEGAKSSVADVNEIGIAVLAAALSVVGSTLASGIALKTVATAGFAACTERPELRTQLIIIGGLAEGIAIYGLLVAILILGKI